eukprot:5285691-Amphidinium_carterae.1
MSAVIDRRSTVIFQGLFLTLNRMLLFHILGQAQGRPTRTAASPVSTSTSRGGPSLPTQKGHS